MTDSTASLDRLQAALADRYLIERELGQGGAATVYLARDLKHGRLVALKVLRADVAAALGADRFLREIEIAAGLTHPHILALHDSGEAAGSLYYVMPYIEGESLRERLVRESPFPLSDVLALAREMADALDYAHRHGVVHRDIKPENILLSDGHALVADFGIARAISTATSANITDTGMAIGTPAYMSPEQATSAPSIDGRTDVYALGCVVYEMLAGHPPFLGATALEVLARHTFDPVPPLRTIRRELPEGVERAVLKALAKAPADRFPTTSGFMDALDEIGAAGTTVRWSSRPTLVGAAGIAVLGIAYVLLSRPSTLAPRPAPADSAPSVAVLAFTNVGADSTNEPFSDGMADELTTALGKVEGLSVAARTSAFTFKKKGLNAQEIGNQLHVRYIVDGAVRKAENRRRVSAQLIDVASGKELWSDQFEHDARNRDVFAVQDSITRSIVRELRVKLSVGSSALLAKRSTEDPEAHDLYLQGRYFFARRDVASLRKAQSYFERAIEKDSLYALAYAGLSEAYSHSSVFGGFPPRAVFLKAKAAVHHALRLDSTLVEAHTAQGFISLFYDWDWPAAGREFDRALALDPRYPPAHLFRAWYFVAIDQMKDAIGEFRTAVQLDPFSPVNNARLATGFLLSRRYDEALAQARKVVELDSTFSQIRAELGRAYLWLGRCPEALTELEKGEQTLPIQQGMLGYASARCGRRAQATAQLDFLAARAREGRYISHYAFAMIHAGLGDTQHAFAELDSAITERAWAMFAIRGEAAFDGIRSDPRFARLLERIGPVQ